MSEAKSRQTEAEARLTESTARLAKINVEREALEAKIKADAPTMTAIGTNGQLYLYKNKVRISREGHGFTQFIQGPTGDTEIFLSSITLIRLTRFNKNSSYISFKFMGDTLQEFRQGINENPYAVIFNNQQEAAFIKIKAAIEEAKSQLETNKNVTSSPAAPVSSGISAVDEISKYADLYSKGILTEEEFTLKKRQLLGL